MKASKEKCKKIDVDCNRSDETAPQKIMVFQQNGSGESKIKGVRQYGGSRYILEVFSIDVSLPPVIDEMHGFLPKDIKADLVLDFLKHPDLSNDLIGMCSERKIPVVASGKKFQNKWPHTPPT